MNLKRSKKHCVLLSCCRQYSQSDFVVLVTDMTYDLTVSKLLNNIMLYNVTMFLLSNCIKRLIDKVKLDPPIYFVTLNAAHLDDIMMSF